MRGRGGAGGGRLLCRAQVGSLAGQQDLPRSFHLPDSFVDLSSLTWLHHNCAQTPISRVLGMIAGILENAQVPPLTTGTLHSAHFPPSRKRSGPFKVSSCDVNQEQAVCMRSIYNRRTNPHGAVAIADAFPRQVQQASVARAIFGSAESLKAVNPVVIVRQHAASSHGNNLLACPRMNTLH